MDGYLTTSQVARVLGVSSKTITLWHKRKLLLPDIVTCGGHRRYLELKILEILGSDPRNKDQVVSPTVYAIRNIENGKKYVGSSIDEKDRRIHHFSLLRHNKHPNSHLQYSFNKYGESKFVFEILCQCEEVDMLSLEKFYIESLRACDRKYGYNIKPDPTCFRHSEETKQKISESLKGHSVSLESRKQMRLRKIGNKNRGTKPLSEESKKKISEALTGRKHSAETLRRRKQSMDAYYARKKRENL